MLVETVLGTAQAKSMRLSAVWIGTFILKLVLDVLTVKPPCLGIGHEHVNASIEWAYGD